MNIRGLFRILFLQVVDRKSTRLNSSHRCISYAVFCLKKNKIPTMVQGQSVAFLPKANSATLPDIPIIAGPFFFFNDTATTEIYTLSLHDALPISVEPSAVVPIALPWMTTSLPAPVTWSTTIDRKSTRLNSSHLGISYAVFCL